MIPMGKVEKMQIRAFKNPQSSQALAEYEFMVNPSSYSEKYTVDYNKEVAPGNNGTEAKYQVQRPGEWEFEILIDGTGVIKKANALDPSLIGKKDTVDVEKEVARLRSLAVDLHGDTHRNYYLKVAWGDKDIFKGSLASLHLNYKLFKVDGTPLRVIAKICLIKWVPDQERHRKNNQQSPDITHERVVKENDRFALMCYNIYEDTQYYLDVAKVNKLDSFRRVRTGKSIKFPPLK